MWIRVKKNLKIIIEGVWVGDGIAQDQGPRSLPADIVRPVHRSPALAPTDEETRDSVGKEVDLSGKPNLPGKPE